MFTQEEKDYIIECLRTYIDSAYAAIDEVWASRQLLLDEIELAKDIINKLERS